MKVTEEEFREIAKLNGRYKLLHEKLNEIEEYTESLKIRQSAIESLLDSAREEENELINKLEEKYNRKFDANALIEILKININEFIK